MKILIADDHDLLRDTVTAFVEATGTIETVGVSDLSAALRALDDKGPFDLVLLDYNMPGMNGVDGVKQVAAHTSKPRVALISGEASRDVVQKAMDAGASGFVPKTLPATSLVNAIRFMAAGEQFIPAGLMQAEEKDAPMHPLVEMLTRREMQVLEGLSYGKSNKEIARDLDLSEPTVKLHVKNLYRKIGAANRTQAAIIARDAGLFGA